MRIDPNGASEQFSWSSRRMVRARTFRQMGNLGGEGDKRTMKPIRLGRFAALGAVLALAVPAVASANEVTNWNEITISTVNMQPAITSAPPAGSIFVAMTQGAVYGAVNAIDRRGRPYLVNRRFPMASTDAAAATSAFRVLDSLFPAQHGTLQAAYDISLAGIPD